MQRVMTNKMKGKRFTLTWINFDENSKEEV